MQNRKDDFLGRGWAFPVRPGPDGGLRLARQEEAVRNSIFLILSTAPGERVMRPEFGCGIHDLVFEANTAGLRGTIQVQVREALARHEHRIDVLEVRVEAAPSEGHKMLIRIDYRLRSNNALFNLVYPFFLQEGAL